ncbi:hypothetical protein DPMN_144194 [Dreissena polymorpha]|uniref:Uncharacterized protein n=1 Tax=Dreissena polymorpha TaxID=45954 RepID=A0A9D4GF53_DREPO|nr:hypothetical protein DPMN_144194 [Dreissena polymorpha]
MILPEAGLVFEGPWAWKTTALPEPVTYNNKTWKKTTLYEIFGAQEDFMSLYDYSVK